jgi:hypothetical protein
MTTCIGPAPLREDDLFAVLDGDATPAMHTHLTDCAFCRARFERVRTFDEGLLGALALGTESTEAFRAATAPWFQERLAPPTKPSPSLWDRAVGVVRQLIPQPMLTVHGLKGSDDGTVQRLSARMERVTLVLEAYPTDTAGQVRLKGMILDEADTESDDDDAPFRWAGSLVELGQGGIPVHVTMLDTQAEFVVNPITLGAWDMQISANWGEVLQLQGVILT